MLDDQNDIQTKENKTANRKADRYGNVGGEQLKKTEKKENDHENLDG